jgi:hypothetical protein
VELERLSSLLQPEIIELVEKKKMTLRDARFKISELK